MSSSCALAPRRNPPPGLRAEAKTRAAVPGPSRRPASNVDSVVTSMTGVTAAPRSGSGSDGR